MVAASSTCSTYRDLVRLMHSISDAKDGPLSADSANAISVAYRSLACTDPTEAEVHCDFYCDTEVHFKPAVTLKRSGKCQSQAGMDHDREIGGSLIAIVVFTGKGVRAHLEDAEEKAAKVVSQLPASQDPKEEDIQSIVQMCLVKMGDLARYLSDIPLAHNDGKTLQEQALNDAAEYYLQAQQLDSSIGMIYNQLGAVLERKDAATNNVCLGACMHFGIAATAQAPARSGIVNFRRSIGIHRNALQSFVQEHSLEFPATMQSRKWTHAVHLLSICVVPVFGPGVDQVDVDKSKELWLKTEPFLRAVLLHPHYERCVKLRRPDEDIGVQAACFACICVWYAHEQLKHCTDQVESMGHSTVFSTLAPILIGMAQVYADSAVAILRSPDGPRLQVLGRCIGALLLLLHVMIHHVDDQVYVQARDDTQAFTEACETLAVSLAASTSHGGEWLPKAMQECTFFHGSSAFNSLTARVGRDGSGSLPVSETVQALALRLTSIDWHEPVRQVGLRLSASMEQLLCSCTHNAAAYSGKSTSLVTSVDELDDIVLLPGQLAQRM